MVKFSKVTDNIILPELDSSESKLELYDKTNPDRRFFNLVDEELIRLAGSTLFYYKYFQSRVDDVYMEERSKTISTEPIKVFGHYEPRAIEQNLSQFGIQLENDQLFAFNKSYIERKIGRTPVAGDVIKPDFQNLKYEIYEVQEDSFEAYGVYRLNCFARLLRDSSDVGNQNAPMSDPAGSTLDLRTPHVTTS